LAAPAASAHHSITGRYDVNKRITLEGTVIEFNYTNPHATIQLQVGVAGAGETERWFLQWLNPVGLHRRGYTRDVIRPGDRVTVSGNPARDGSNLLRLLHLQRASDGFEYEATTEEEYLLIPGQ